MCPGCFVCKVDPDSAMAARAPQNTFDEVFRRHSQIDPQDTHVENQPEEEDTCAQQGGQPFVKARFALKYGKHGDLAV